MRRRWYFHRTVVFLGVIALLWGGWFAYSEVAARHKTDPAILAALDRHQPVDIWTELPFTPEEFHIRYMQDRGTVTGVSGNWIHLTRVKPAAAWTIARQYWVERVAANR